MPAVKKLLIILLLTILPFQFSWAAAAVYCEHGQLPSTATHFGHHEHQFDADYHEKNGDGDLSKVHGDCGYCHAAALQAFFALPLLPTVVPPPRIYNATPPQYFSSHFPEGPRRPDRLPAA